MEMTSVNNVELLQTLTVDTISEKTSDSGVTIDSVVLKDNTVTATTLTANMKCSYGYY